MHPQDLPFDQTHTLDVNYNLSVIAFTLLVYEYCLTFRVEVERFWSSPARTWPGLFFFLNRYFTLLGHIPVMVEYFWASTAPDKSEICRHLQRYHQYFAIIIQIFVSVLLIMRTYALYDRSRRILALLLAVSLAAVAIGCVFQWSILTGMKRTPRPNFILRVGCEGTLTKETALRFAAAWSGMLAFDTFIFILTVYKSVTLGRVTGTNLLTLMLRDGSMYFGVMIAVNLGNIMTFVYGGVFIRGVGTMFMNVVSSIMATRLMLNLRDPKLVAQCSGGKGRTKDTAGYSEPMISTFIDARTGTGFTDIGYNSQMDEDDDTFTSRLEQGAHAYNRNTIGFAV